MPGKRGRRGSPGRRSHTARAELSFSVSHMERLLREGHYAQRLSSSAPVYLVAIIQYLAARVLELARHEAQNSSRRRLTLELVDLAARSNALLRDLFRTIAPSPRWPRPSPSCPTTPGFPAPGGAAVRRQVRSPTDRTARAAPACPPPWAQSLRVNKVFQETPCACFTHLEWEVVVVGHPSSEGWGRGSGRSWGVGGVESGVTERSGLPR
ncbi:histone H2A-Bbd type 1 [Tursiops truncatus]|uniref:histone H2A-Bbd type 1 n=1 Tax=Tursiops truncatus TaxID=9739 RepID=UPI003CCFB9AF